MKTQHLFNCVRAWGIAKGITGPEGKASAFTQYNKFVEEGRELQEAINKGDQAHAMEELGDCIVTLILLAERLGFCAESALETAYLKISQRSGRMVDGVFVKDKPEQKEETNEQ